MSFGNDQDLAGSLDSDLQDFIQTQQQKAQLQSSAHKLTGQSSIDWLID